MGCDIHLYVEKRNADGKWEALKGPNPWIESYEDSARLWTERAEQGGIKGFSAEVCRERAEHAMRSADHYRNATLEEHIATSDKWRDEHGSERESIEELTREFNEYDGPEVFKDWIWDGRNYNLFAMLANVRNGWGFAGIETGHGFIPIAEPRGLPSDVTEYVKAQSDRWDVDGHSHSHHTVAQLLGYDWNRTTIHYGVVSEEQFKVFQEKGKPESWCGAVSGGDIIHVGQKVMEEIVAGNLSKQYGKEYYTRVDWSEPYHESAGNFYTKSLPKLQELAGDDLESVRIVFWFDN